MTLDNTLDCRQSDAKAWVGCFIVQTGKGQEKIALSARVKANNIVTNFYNRRT